MLPPPWPGVRPEVELATADGQLITPGDRAEAARIEALIERIGPDLARWGEFRFRVQVRIYPSHESLEKLLALDSHPWLRAWSWKREIALQSPRSWDPDLPDVPDAALEELLSHEFTHALMYQLLEGDGDPRPEPPLWFREGMASYTANQGSRRLQPAKLARWVATHPGVDLLRPSAETYRVEKEAVYGAAHRAFEILLQRSGERGVRDLLHYASEGRSFEQAFRLAIGRSVQAFEDESVRMGFDAHLAVVPTERTGAGGF